MSRHVTFGCGYVKAKDSRHQHVQIHIKKRLSFTYLNTTFVTFSTNKPPHAQKVPPTFLLHLVVILEQHFLWQA